MKELAAHARALRGIGAATVCPERLEVERDLARGEHLLFVAEHGRGEEVQEAVLAAGRERVVEPRGRLEELAARAARADERRHLVHLRHPGAAAAKLRLPLAEDQRAVPLLGAVDDCLWLCATSPDLFGPDDESVRQPGVFRGADPLPLRERFVEWQLGRREQPGVVEEVREQRRARVRSGS